MGLFGDIKDALFGDSPRVNWPKISKEERRLLAERTGLTEDYIDEVSRVYDQIRSARDEFMTYERPEEEIRTSGLLRDRLESILRGDVDREDTALEQDISKEYEKLENEMSRRLGPDWRMSTPGVQSLRAFNEWAERSRSENRLMQRGYDTADIGTMGGLLDAESARNLDIYRTNVEAGMANDQMRMQSLGLLPAAFRELDPIIGYYTGNRQMKMAQRAANAGLRQSQQAGAMNVLGAGAGLLLGGQLGNIFSQMPNRTTMLPSSGVGQYGV